MATDPTAPTDIDLQDALAGTYDRDAEWEQDAQDESEFAAHRREAAETWAAEMREQLTAVRSRKRVYRMVALRWHRLPAERHRALCYFLEKADADLDNVFPARATAAAVLGITPKGYDRTLAWLRTHGWIKTHEFRRPDGTQSSSGIQLGIPFPSGAWWGPATFSRRRAALRRATRRSHPEWER